MFMFSSTFALKYFRPSHTSVRHTARLTLRFLFLVPRSVRAAGGSALPAAAACQPPGGQHLPPGHVRREELALTDQGKTQSCVLKFSMEKCWLLFKM